MDKSVEVLAGDSNPEIVGAAVSVLEVVGDFEFREALIGGAAIDYCGDPMPLVTRRVARASHAILLGPVGGPEWESDDPRDPVPETAIRTLQKTLDVHAFVQPVATIAGLAEISPLKPDHAENVDFVIVRALGGIENGQSGRNWDMRYDKIEYSPQEIRDVGRTAFDLAIARSSEIDRRPVVTSVDKSNVMETSRTWRATMADLQRQEYPGVEIKHLLADNAAMQVTGNPRGLDVVVVDSFFGDMLAGAAAGVSNPGLIPSAWLNKKGRGIYTPAREEGMANPIPMILSAAMALEYSLDMPEEAKRVKSAVTETINSGILPQDLGGAASNQEFTGAVIQNLSAVTA